MAHSRDRSPGTSIPVDARGRILLPADVRKDLNLSKGDRLIVQRPAPGVVQLLSAREAASRLRGALTSRSEGRSLVQELLEERRREAAE